MASKRAAKLDTALKRLQSAIKAYKEANEDNDLEFMALVKAFEVAIEYAWRELKIKVEDEGLDAPSPKAAVKQAAKIGIISEPEACLLCIDARNNSVHDYFGISEKEYMVLAEKLVKLAKI